MPAAPSQKRLWFLERLGGEGALYALLFTLGLHGRLDRAALRLAVERTTQRHPLLSCIFEEQADEVLQVVRQGWHPRWEERCVEREQIDEVAREVAREPFDLARGPLFRVQLLCVDDEHHVLVLALHHTIVDTWSLGVLMAHLAEEYSAVLRGAPIGPRGASFRAHAIASLPRAEALAADGGAHWRGRLGAFPAFLEWGWQRRPSHGAAGNVESTLSPDVVQRLEAASRLMGSTLFMQVAVALACVLARRTRQRRIVLGTSVAGRGARSVDTCVGPVANVVPFAFDLTGDVAFDALLERAGQTWAEDSAFHELPFEQVVEALSPPRDAERTPIFQVLLVVQTAAPSSLDVEGVRFVPRRVPLGSAIFDLTVDVARRPDGAVHVELEFARAVFTEAEARRLLDHLTDVLDRVARRDAGPWFDASEVPAAEIALRRRFAAGPAAIRGSVDVGELVERAVAAHGDEPALREAGRLWSYRELWRDAAAVRSALSRLGVGPGCRVGVQMKRTARAAIALLGIVMAGAAYVPLDPAYPEARLDVMRRTAQLSWTVVDRAPGPGEVAFEDVVVQRGEPLSRSLADRDDPLYVIFTSGSTGAPKGVVVTHGVIATLLEEQRGTFPGRRVTAQRTSLSFDVSAQEIFGTWIAGGCVVVADDEVRGDPGLFVQLLATERIERLYLPFVGLQSVAEAILVQERVLALREVITAGEQLLVTPAIIEAFGRLPGCILVNQYGPSETHVVTQQDLQGPPATWPHRPSIGRPVAGSWVRVVDEMMLEVPVGTPGELLLGGESVGQGYFGRPALTAERFVPAEADGGRRAYRSGDVARWSDDGTLEFLGRADDQVKIRGVRVEPAEVESVLASLPSIGMACVAPWVVDGVTELVAFVPASSEGGRGEWARGELQRLLPSAMVPARVVEVPEFPRTPSGKIDRRRLVSDAGAAWRLAARSSPGVPAPASSDEETPEVVRIVVETFARALSLPSVRPDDSFFALGGHSLLAMKVVSRLAATLRMEVRTRDLFDAPTPGELGRLLESRRQDRGDTTNPIEPIDPQTPALMSLGQARMWVLQQIDPRSTVYLMPATVRITGRLDIEALERAIRAVAARQAVLRTALVLVDGEPVQQPLDEVPRLEIVDLRSLDRASGERRARDAAAAEWGEPIDVTSGRLLRCRLLRIADDAAALLVTLHHAAGDASSVPILLDEMVTAYAAAAVGASPYEAEPRIRYVDYAAWERRRADEAAASGVLEEMVARLRDSPRPRIAGELRTGEHDEAGHLRATLGREVWERIEGVARTRGTTAFAVFVAAVAEQLGRESLARDVTLGLPVSTRTREELQPLVGFFVNTLVLRIRWSATATFDELVEITHRELTYALDHQHVPFERLVQAADPPRDIGETPLFRVMVARVAHDATYERHAGGATFSLEGSTPRHAPFDLTVSLDAGAKSGAIALEYRLATLGDEPARGWLERIVARVGVLTGESGARLDAPWLSPAEVASRITPGVGPRPVADADHLLSFLERTPAGAPAIVLAASVTAYGALRDRALRLAGALRASGVSVGDRVATLVWPSDDLVVAWLGILAAGAAVVPVDPGLPRARRQLFLDAAGARCVVGAGDAATETSTSGLVVVSPHAEGEPFAAPLTGELPAYLMFTSGSTGEPKPVLVSHRSATSFASTAARRYGLRPQDRFLQACSTGFDAFVEEVFGAFAAGAAVAVVPRTSPLVGDEIEAAIERLGATVMSVTPSVLSTVRPTAAGGLRVVILGGETVSVELARRWAGVVELYNSYGPTEATVVVTIGRVQPDAEEILLGEVVDGARIYILDDALAPVPVGGIGELFLAGDCLAHGYWGRPAETASRFVPDPFSSHPGGRMYRTGDLGVRRANGGLAFIGRADDQVKIGGVRTEPGEVRAAVERHPAVRAAHVGVGAVAARPALVAWYEGDVTVEELRSHLLAQLPPAMVPRGLVRVESLPRSSTGKLDPRALPQPLLDDVTPSRRLPQGPTEARLCELFTALLGRPVGPEDDLFAAGLTSIAAAQAVQRIRGTMNVDLAIRAIFEATTIERLASLVGAAPAPAASSIPRVERSRVRVRGRGNGGEGTS